MHTVSEMGTSVPAFLGKLWRLVEDPSTDDLICWSPNGRSFFIRNQARFARELLPHYYKHNNMASFVRQLNMYGFHKKVSVELGGLKCDRDEMEFAHQYFCKDHPYLLDHIKRKIASNKSQDPSQQPIKPELMNKMLTEVRSMRGRQEHFDSKLGVMKRENEALWRELALLRQKHHKQQQIVNKLIHFFVTLANPNRNSGISVKRRYPLMIDDASRQKIKQNKLSKVHYSPSGPAIHELDTDLDSDYIVAEMLDADSTPTVESPEHHSVSEENMREYYIDDSAHIPHEVESSQNPNGSRKKLKGKKKGEETFLLEMPSTTKVQVIPATAAMTASQNRVRHNTVKSSTTVPPKPVPLATVRSSKLAAMAANMKKSTEASELELDLEALQDDKSENLDSRDDSMIKLENILIVPDVEENYSPEMEDHNGSTMPSSVSSMSSRASNNSPGGSGLNMGDHSPDVIADMGNGDFGNLDFMGASNSELASSLINSSSQQKSSNSATDKSQKDSQKNMTLSCVNQGSMNEATYRLDST